MPRSDALTSLKRLAEELQFFRPGLPVTYRTARACLDVLGALNADAGGTIAQMPLPVRAAVAVQLHDQPCLRIRSAQIVPPVGESEITLPSDRPLDHARGQAAWAAGIAALWSQTRPNAPGASILIHSDIPQNVGQSSSTALLAAVALALGDERQRPSPLSIAQRVAAAETLLSLGTTQTISAGSVIHALTCLHLRAMIGEPALRRGDAASGGVGGGGQPYVLRYSAQPHRFVGAVPVPPDVRIIALDTGVRYAAGHAGWSGDQSAGMEEFRTAVAMGLRMIDAIYRDLGQPHTPLHGYLANASPLLYRQYFRALLPRRIRAGDFVRTYGPLPEFLIDTEEQKARLFRVRTAVDHIISEHEHAEQFLQAFEELAEAQTPGGGGEGASRGGTRLDESERQRILQRTGRLLLASHHSYRLRLELSCREADWLVDRLMQAGPDRGIYGARITAHGGGGTVAALLARSPDATDALLEVIHAYNHLTGLVLGVTEP